jgi:hypothetical protein
MVESIGPIRGGFVVVVRVGDVRLRLHVREGLAFFTATDGALVCLVPVGTA